MSETEARWAVVERRLIAMEDERDAALLEVERLQQVIDNGQKMIEDLRKERDELVGQLDEAKLVATVSVVWDGSSLREALIREARRGGHRP